MRTIYYKQVIEWEKYPWQDEVKNKYVEFFYKEKKKIIKYHGFKMKTNTTIKEKEDYLKEVLKLEKVKVLKLK